MDPKFYKFYHYNNVFLTLCAQKIKSKQNSIFIKDFHGLLLLDQMCFENSVHQTSIVSATEVEAAHECEINTANEK